ncbi:hypothetical protein [Streptomyces sp. NBC_00996]|uniref:hypothetical protein n=1 Tax=Streptomyces sp. NBC_00996 TaxID=2903710 RepID=UPI003869A67B|nr:hypothetical protein OG390_04060 [Streptomyces sp. NBC_00996]
MRGARHAALTVVGAIAAVLLLTACGGHGEDTQRPASSPSTDLAHLQKLVDDAASAASSAESDIAKE